MKSLRTCVFLAAVCSCLVGRADSPDLPYPSPRQKQIAAEIEKAALAAVAAGEQEKALNLLDKAIEAWGGAHRGDLVYVRTNHFLRAKLLKDMERYDEAMEALSCFLEPSPHADFTQNPAIDANGFNLLGTLCVLCTVEEKEPVKAKRFWEVARVAYQNALICEEMAERKDNPSLKAANVAAIRMNLASAERALGNYQHARELCLAVVRAFQELGATESSQMVNCLGVLAAVDEAEGKPQAAVPLLEKMLDLAGKIYDEDHPLVVQTKKRLEAAVAAVAASKTDSGVKNNSGDNTTVAQMNAKEFWLPSLDGFHSGLAQAAKAGLAKLDKAPVKISVVGKPQADGQLEAEGNSSASPENADVEALIERAFDATEAMETEVAFKAIGDALELLGGEQRTEHEKVRTLLAIRALALGRAGQLDDAIETLSFYRSDDANPKYTLPIDYSGYKTLGDLCLDAAKRARNPEPLRKSARNAFLAAIALCQKIGEAADCGTRNEAFLLAKTVVIDCFLADWELAKQRLKKAEDLLRELGSEESIEDAMCLLGRALIAQQEGDLIGSHIFLTSRTAILSKHFPASSNEVKSAQHDQDIAAQALLRKSERDGGFFPKKEPQPERRSTASDDGNVGYLALVLSGCLWCFASMLITRNVLGKKPNFKMWAVRWIMLTIVWAVVFYIAADWASRTGGFGTTPGAMIPAGYDRTPFLAHILASPLSLLIAVFVIAGGFGKELAMADRRPLGRAMLTLITLVVGIAMNFMVWGLPWIYQKVIVFADFDVSPISRFSAEVLEGLTIGFVAPGLLLAFLLGAIALVSKLVSVLR